MAKKPKPNTTKAVIPTREPLTIGEVAYMLECDLVKLKNSIAKTTDKTTRRTLEEVARDLSEIIEADVILSFRPIDNLAV